MYGNIDELIAKLKDPVGEEVYRDSDRLAEIGGTAVIEKLIPLLYHTDYNTMYLAARTLRLMNNNEEALVPLLEAIHDPQNRDRNGSLVEALGGFNCSRNYVDLFRIYLTGNLKASAMAKLLLDFEEFEISPRTIRKIEKHWHHYSHNAAHDERFEEKKIEAESILKGLKSLFEA